MNSIISLYKVISWDSDKFKAILPRISSNNVYMYDEAMRCINRDAPTTEKTLPTAFKAPKPVAKETEAMTTLFYFVESDVHKFRDDCFIDAESMVYQVFISTTV